MGGFDWDDGNVDHIRRHGVVVYEAEEALEDPRRVGLPIRGGRDEPRRAMLGATEAGRVLFIVFTRRGRAIRVVTARDATQDERRRYWR